MKRWNLLVGSLSAAALIATAGAQTTIYDTSFESPAFTPGSINGQDGWANGSGSGASQIITGNFARTGNQSLYWENTSLVSFYSVRRSFDGQSGAIGAATPLEMSVWVFVNPGTGLDRLYGIYATNSGTGTLGSTTLGITISGTGAIRAGTTWSQTYSTTPDRGDDASLVNSWVRLVLRYDRVGGSAQVFDSSNSLIFTETYASVTLGNANGTGTNSWNINLGTDYVGTAARTGSGYMDDFRVWVVPEPASMVALGAGLAGLLGLRRRKK